MPLRPESGDALLAIDVQNDFLPEGALAVPDGDAVVAPLNAYIERFQREGLPVFFTRDWHTPDHCSFRDRGGPWPPHCIAGSPGAGFAPGLHLPPGAIVVSKATTAEKDAYSGFQGTALDAELKRLGVGRVWVGGLATDYCVLNTVRDALALGYRVVLLADAIRAVDVKPGDGAAAEREMLGKGALPMTLAELA